MEQNDYIVRITSIDAQNENFDGTGFILNDSSFDTYYYVITCAHVVESVSSGSKKIKAGGKDAEVIVNGFSCCGERKKIDLAVLKVHEKSDLEPITLHDAHTKDTHIRIPGFYLFESSKKLIMLEPLTGMLGETCRLESFDAKQEYDSTDCRKLIISEKNSIKKGYSGSPVFDHTNAIIGVASFKVGGGETGFAVAIRSLQKIWPSMPFSIARCPDTGPSVGYESKFLPYLCNRSKQHHELEEFLLDRFNCHSIFFLVIHGTTSECHVEFIEKIQKHLVKQILSLPHHKDDIRLICFDWPCSAKENDTRFKRLVSNLAQQLTKEGNNEDIIPALHKQTDILLLYTRIFSQQWDENDDELIDRWIEYWTQKAKAQTISLGKKIFVCLSIEYQECEKLGWFESRKGKKRNKQAREYISTVEKNFTQLQSHLQPSLCGLVFSELCSICQPEVEKWIDTYAKPFCVDCSSLRMKVKKEYENVKNLEIPMDVLADTLKKFLAEQ